MTGRLEFNFNDMRVSDLAAVHYELIRAFERYRQKSAECLSLNEWLRRVVDSYRG